MYSTMFQINILADTKIDCMFWDIACFALRKLAHAIYRFFSAVKIEKKNRKKKYRYF